MVMARCGARCPGRAAAGIYLFIPPVSSSKLGFILSCYTTVTFEVFVVTWLL